MCAPTFRVVDPPVSRILSYIVPKQYMQGNYSLVSESAETI